MLPHLIDPDPYRHIEIAARVGAPHMVQYGEWVEPVGLGQPAVGLCSNTMSDAQVHKLAGYARQFAGGKVTLMLDADAEGDRGAKEGLWKLAEAGLEVRLGWSRSMFDGEFADRQPELLNAEAWADITAALRG